MIVMVRTGEIAPGKLLAAMQFAVKVAMQINEQEGTNTQVLRDVGGMMGRVHWLTTYESLAQMETLAKQMEAKPYYQALLAEGGEQGLFSRITDVIYESIYG